MKPSAYQNALSHVREQQGLPAVITDDMLDNSGSSDQAKVEELKHDPKVQQAIHDWRTNACTNKYFALIEKDIADTLNELVDAALYYGPEDFVSLKSKLVKVHTLKQQLEMKGNCELWLSK